MFDSLNVALCDSLSALQTGSLFRMYWVNCMLIHAFRLFQQLHAGISHFWFFK